MSRCAISQVCRADGFFETRLSSAIEIRDSGVRRYSDFDFKNSEKQLNTPDPHQRLPYPLHLCRCPTCRRAPTSWCCRSPTRPFRARGASQKAIDFRITSVGTACIDHVRWQFASIAHKTTPVHNPQNQAIESNHDRNASDEHHLARRARHPRGARSCSRKRGPPSGSPACPARARAPSPSRWNTPWCSAAGWPTCSTATTSATG